MILGEKVRNYRDGWGAKNTLCLACFDALEEDRFLTIEYPAYAEGSCEQCGEEYHDVGEHFA
jgi:hypothetical protein